MKSFKRKAKESGYFFLSSIPLFCAEFTAFEGLRTGDYFYLAVASLTGVATITNWFRKNEPYTSLDSAIEYFPLPSITIPATIISGFITLDIWVKILSR